MLLNLFLYVHANLLGVAVTITDPVLHEPPDWSRLARLGKAIRMISDSVYSLPALRNLG
jgi:hypothetical protein